MTKYWDSFYVSFPSIYISWSMCSDFPPFLSFITEIWLFLVHHRDKSLIFSTECGLFFILLTVCFADKFLLILKSSIYSYYHFLLYQLCFHIILKIHCKAQSHTDLSHIFLLKFYGFKFKLLPTYNVGSNANWCSHCKTSMEVP